MNLALLSFAPVIGTSLNLGAWLLLLRTRFF